MYVFITDDVTRDEELPSLGNVDDRARRELRWAQVDTHRATICKMPVSGATRPRDSDAGKGAEETKMSKRSGAFVKEEDGGHVGTRGLRKAVEDPISCLDGEGVKIGAKVGRFKKNARHTKSSPPHAFHERILLRRVYGRGPMTNLLGREEVPKEMGHKLRTLVSDNHVWQKFVSKSHV